MIVTGGKGFIGTNLLNKVEGRSFDVKDGEDIRNSYQCRDHLNRDIVHLAALSGIPASINNPRLSHDINVTGTINVLDAAMKHGKKVILASSAAAENASTPYGAFKRANELYAEAFHQTYGLEYVALRFSNVYGPHSMHKTSVVAQMCKDAILKGEIYVNGDCSRDFIHVNDVVRAIELALLEADRHLGIKNIGSGILTRIIDIAEIVSRETSAKIVRKPAREGDTKAEPMDIVMSDITLRWKPTVDLETGLLETIEWFKSELCQTCEISV